jgi:hypothetical protein
VYPSGFMRDQIQGVEDVPVTYCTVELWYSVSVLFVDHPLPNLNAESLKSSIVAF